MTEKRFTIRPQDDYFGVNDCLQEFNVVNGIHTEIEAKWLCDLLNELHEENTQFKEALKELKEIGDYQNNRIKELNQQLESEHQMLDNAILLERTRMGKNSLKQYKESIQ